jgi:hypothetical protein
MDRYTWYIVAGLIVMVLLTPMPVGRFSRLLKGAIE